MYLPVNLATFSGLIARPWRRACCSTACSTFAPQLGQNTLALPSLALHWGQLSLRRVSWCWMMGAPFAKSTPSTPRARASLTQQPSRTGVLFYFSKFGLQSCLEDVVEAVCGRCCDLSYCRKEGAIRHFLGNGLEATEESQRILLATAGGQC